MRKRIRVLLLAALVAAIVVPVGFALSLPSGERAGSASRAVVPVAQVGASHPSFVASTAVVTSVTPSSSALPAVPEGAKLFAIGTALFGLAAAMRRTSRPPRID